MYSVNDTQNVRTVDQLGRIVIPNELIKKFNLIVDGYVSAFTNENNIILFRKGDFNEEASLYINDLRMVNIEKLNKSKAKYFNIKCEKNFIILVPYLKHCHFCGYHINDDDIFYYDRRICKSCYSEIQNENFEIYNSETNLNCSCCEHETDKYIIYNGKAICPTCYNDIVNTKIT